MSSNGDIGASIASMAPHLGDKNFFSTKAKVDELFASATPLLASKLQSSLIELRSKYDLLHLKYYPESAHSVSYQLIILVFNVTVYCIF
jgi:hypothetical protein